MPMPACFKGDKPNCKCTLLDTWRFQSYIVPPGHASALTRAVSLSLLLIGSIIDLLFFNPPLTDLPDTEATRLLGSIQKRTIAPDSPPSRLSAFPSLLLARIRKSLAPE